MGGEEGAKARRLRFSGQLTFANADGLRRRILKALGSERVEISFGQVQEVDLSFLQLLCAALRSAAGASRALTVAEGPVPPAVRELVETAGMISPLGGAEDGFWIRLAGRNESGRGDE